MVKRVSENYAPYAATGNVVSVIRLFRQAGLSWPMTNDVIARTGVSEGNAPRTLNTFQFLKLIDEKGNRTEILDKLGRATSEEYPTVLEDIIREAYADIFAFIDDPSTASDVMFFDAFRTKQPEKQRSRMVSLFKGLCKEANLLKGGPPKVQRRIKSSLTKTADKSKKEPIRQERQLGVDLTGNGSEYWYRKLEPLFTKLPKPSNPHWRPDEREKWHQALTALLDLYIEIDSGPDDEKEIPF